MSGIREVKYEILEYGMGHRVKLDRHGVQDIITLAVEYLGKLLRASLGRLWKNWRACLGHQILGG